MKRRHTKPVFSWSTTTTLPMRQMGIPIPPVKLHTRMSVGFGSIKVHTNIRRAGTKATRRRRKTLGN